MPRKHIAISFFVIIGLVFAYKCCSIVTQKTPPTKCTTIDARDGKSSWGRMPDIYVELANVTERVSPEMWVQTQTTIRSVNLPNTWKDSFDKVGVGDHDPRVVLFHAGSGRRFSDRMLLNLSMLTPRFQAPTGERPPKKPASILIEIRFSHANLRTFDPVITAKPGTPIEAFFQIADSAWLTRQDSIILPDARKGTVTQSWYIKKSTIPKPGTFWGNGDAHVQDEYELTAGPAHSSAIAASEGYNDDEVRVFLEVNPLVVRTVPTGILAQLSAGWFEIAAIIAIILCILHLCENDKPRVAEACELSSPSNSSPLLA